MKINLILMGNRLAVIRIYEDAKRYVAAHHPFTSPKQEY